MSPNYLQWEMLKRAEQLEKELESEFIRLYEKDARFIEYLKLCKEIGIGKVNKFYLPCETMPELKKRGKDEDRPKTS